MCIKKKGLSTTWKNRKFRITTWNFPKNIKNEKVKLQQQTKNLQKELKTTING